jgi:flavin-dependent dehydrogenase
MTDRCDVVVVGARCAGSPLATLLARGGLRVVVVERDTFPRDTLSTHCLHAQALTFLDRLGVTAAVRATGAPYLRHLDIRLQDLEFRGEIPQLPGDVGGFASVRRLLLDPILAETAAAAGAELRTGTTATGLLEEHGRVGGVRVRRNGAESTVRARLVVGADGRNSTVASLVGARKYNVTPSERFAYWTFFEAGDWAASSSFVYHRWADRLVFGGPADSALFQVIVVPELSALPRFRRDLEGSFMEHVHSCAPIADALAGARRVGRFFGVLRWEGFFREASGPGWVLVGDAGHFKDPTPAQGIQDAFRQVDEIAPAILEAATGGEERLDRAVRAWARWRDRDAAEHYWLATDLGKAGAVPAVLPELTRGLLAQGKIDRFLDLLTHRSRPSEVLTPARLFGATGRLMARRGCDRRALLGEVSRLIAVDARRRLLGRRPRYAASERKAPEPGDRLPASRAAPAHLPSPTP